MGILLCEQNFRDVWRRNKSVRAEIGQILRTHTHAAQLVVEIEAALSATVIFLSRLEPTPTKKLLNPSAMLCLLTILISLHSKWLESLDVLVFLLIIAFSIFHVLLMFPFASVNNLE